MRGQWWVTMACTSTRASVFRISSVPRTPVAVGPSRDGFRRKNLSQYVIAFCSGNYRNCLRVLLKSKLYVRMAENFYYACNTLLFFSLTWKIVVYVHNQGARHLRRKTRTTVRKALFLVPLAPSRPLPCTRCVVLYASYSLQYCVILWRLLRGGGDSWSW